jgi:hypothetical protein
MTHQALPLQLGKDAPGAYPGRHAGFCRRQYFADEMEIADPNERETASVMRMHAFDRSRSYDIFLWELDFTSENINYRRSNGNSTSRWRGCADTIGIDSFSEPRSS